MVGSTGWAVLALACLQVVSIVSSLELSSHACSPDTTNEKFRTCTFHNLVLQDGQAYYLAKGGRLPLPAHHLRAASSASLSRTRRRRARSLQARWSCLPCAWTSR